MAITSTNISIETPLDDDLVSAIHGLDNNALIIRLANTINHLSRWLTPIHDRTKLERSRYHGEPTVKQILLDMRDFEQFMYPRMYAVTDQASPDFDTIPAYAPSETVKMADQERSTIELMGSYRRLRQSTCGLLRHTPDDAWDRVGFSRRHRNMTLRQLAEELLNHDYRALNAMDATLNVTGAREGIADIQTVPLRTLVNLSPSQVKL